MPHLLSKSKYIRGLQCDRGLWLDVHNPRLAKYTREQMQRFDRGREFEYAFKDTFPNGIDISAELRRNVDAYPELTARLLDEGGPLDKVDGRTLGGVDGRTLDGVDGTPLPPSQRGDERGAKIQGTSATVSLCKNPATAASPLCEGGRGVPNSEVPNSGVQCKRLPDLVLFEAGFLYDDVLVLADVVRRNPDGSLDIYEVKSGNTLSDTYRRDAALQHYVISHCREINSFNIVYNGQNGQFVIVNLTEELAAQQDDIAANIAAMKAIALSTNEPDTPTGQHCLEPYACPYQAHCQSGVRQLSLF